MKEITQILADAIVDSTNSEWKNAKLIIKLFGGSIDKFLEFEYLDGSIKTAFLVDRGKVSLPLFKLHQSMNEENKKHWNVLTFLLDNEGKFDLNFEWDQAIQDEFERESQS